MPIKNIIDLLTESDSVIIISYEGFDFKDKDSLKTVREGVKLNDIQKKDFQTLLKTEVAGNRDRNDCFNPHHKVYFYTKQGLAWWWICFDCGSKQSAGISFLNAPNIDLEQNGTVAQLFKKFGLTYQL